SLLNQSGRAVDVQTLHDPFANFVLKGGAPLPTTFASLVQLLGRVDNANCTPSSGLSVALVSETSQLIGAPDVFRAVFSRTCGGRLPSKLLLSPMTGVTPSGALPTDVEVLSFDDTRGLYNFYAVEGGTV